MANSTLETKVNEGSRDINQNFPKEVYEIVNKIVKKVKSLNKEEKKELKRNLYQIIERGRLDIRRPYQKYYKGWIYTALKHVNSDFVYVNPIINPNIFGDENICGLIHEKCKQGVDFLFLCGNKLPLKLSDGATLSPKAHPFLKILKDRHHDFDLFKHFHCYITTDFLPHYLCLDKTRAAIVEPWPILDEQSVYISIFCGNKYRKFIYELYNQAYNYLKSPSFRIGTPERFIKVESSN